jgi:hypothetical protein
MKCWTSSLRLMVACAAMLAAFIQSGHAQEKHSPPSEISKLGSILGSFEGEATVTEGGKTMKGKVRHSNLQIADGWGFLMDEVISMEDGSAYKSHNIIGYDAGGGKVHVYSVTNAGESHDHIGSWTNPKTISVQYDGKWEGKAYIEKAALAIDGPDSYTLTWTATLDGKKAGGGEEKLHRVTK